jgi:hypothetical protein
MPKLTLEDLRRRRATVPLVNKALKLAGYEEQIWHNRSDGYFVVCEGNAELWPSSAINRYSISGVTVGDILDDIDYLRAAYRPSAGLR